MKNRWWDACVKTLIFLAVAHIIFLILGFLFRTDIGIFSIPMLWAHWSDSMSDRWIGIAVAVVAYFVIYFAFTGKGRDGIEG